MEKLKRKVGNLADRTESKLQEFTKKHNPANRLAGEGNKLVSDIVTTVVPVIAEVVKDATD